MFHFINIGFPSSLFIFPFYYNFLASIPSFCLRFYCGSLLMSTDFTFAIFPGSLFVERDQTYDCNELEQMLIKLTKGNGLRPHVIERNKNTEN